MVAYLIPQSRKSGDGADIRKGGVAIVSSHCLVPGCLFNEDVLLIITAVMR